VADHLIDARSQTGTAPDEKRKCGIQPAHQSLLTDVFRSRPLLCTIHRCPNFMPVRVRNGITARFVLDLGHQRGFQASHPVPLPRSRIPAESPAPRHRETVPSMLPPRYRTRRLQRTFISRPPRGFSTAAYASRVMLPPSLQGSLPAGWLAFTGRESNPLDRDGRFPSCYISSLG
jgi:hypothetical protein